MDNKKAQKIILILTETLRTDYLNCYGDRAMETPNIDKLVKNIGQRLKNNNFKFIGNKLHDKLLNWMNNTRDPFRGYYWERRSWRDDARAASWDYTGMTRQKKPDTEEKNPLDYNTGLEVTEYTRNKNN